MCCIAYWEGNMFSREPRTGGQSQDFPSLSGHAMACPSLGQTNWCNQHSLTRRYQKQHNLHRLSDIWSRMLCAVAQAHTWNLKQTLIMKNSDQAMAINCSEMNHRQVLHVIWRAHSKDGYRRRSQDRFSFDVAAVVSSCCCHAMVQILLTVWRNLPHSRQMQTCVKTKTV